MLIPCFDHCYIKFGKQYTEECNENCDYAIASLENKKLEQILKSVLIYHNNRKCLYCKSYPTCVDNNCVDYEKYELDLERIMNDYQIV